MLPMTDTKFTPGPWAWFGSPRTNFYLATNHSGRRYVMAFDRMGLNSAQPVFQPVGGKGMVKAKDLCIFEVCRDATSASDPRVYRKDIVGFRCADAFLIAAAPTLFDALEELVSALERGDVHDGHSAIGQSRAALAKARGES